MLRFMAATSFSRRRFDGVTLYFVFRQGKNGGFDFSKPPRLGMRIWLLYDGFFSFAVVRQITSYLLDR
jgi:hypothetical protein